MLSMEKPDHVDRILAGWARERPELDTRALGLFGRLFRVVRLADGELAAGLAPHGLQSGWFDILAALRRSGAPYERNPTDLMRSTLLSSGGITKRLDRLVEEGLVERRPDPEDRRGVRVRLTRRGMALIDEAIETHVRNEERLLEGMDPEERDELDRLLRLLLAGIEEGTEP